MDQNIIVHDVSQEYWYVKKQTCSCGGQFEPQAQKLVIGNGKSPVDLIKTICSDCKRQKDFFFDVSNFHGVERSKKKLEIMFKMKDASMRDLLTYADELTSSPAAKAVDTIINLGKQKDILALEWINEALNIAREQTETVQKKGQESN